MTVAQVANAVRVVREASAAAWQPPPPVDLVKWAEENIVFTKRESSFPGPYDRRNFPYFDEILRALSPDDPCKTVTLCCSAQIGKTVLGNIFVGGSMDMDPGDMLVTHPTEDNAERWSKLKLKPMLRGTARLNGLFPERTREGGDSTLFKERIDGLGAILISGANSPSSLSQVTMPRQFQDDLAKWGTNKAGDPEAQADSRSRAVEFSKTLKASTPLVLPGCRITKNYKRGSQERYYVPCPHCGHMQTLEWENMLATIDPDRPEAAHFTCTAPDCGGVIEEHHRPAMNRAGEWRADNPKAKRRRRSFYIWSAYSLLTSWLSIVEDWLNAKGDSEGERVFLNDTVGRAQETSGEAPSWEKLRDRGSESPYSKGTIPTGGLVLTAGVDCQADRVEVQVVAWGREYRRWIVDHIPIQGHISTDKCRAALDAVLKQSWRNEAGNRIALDMLAIDGNAWTEDVWEWARRHPISRVIMVRGRGEETAPRLARVRRERNEKGVLLRYARRFFNFGASIMKMALYRDLAKEDPQEKGYVGLPKGLDDDFYQQLTAERREERKNKAGFKVYVWTKDKNQPNEALDAHLQAEAAATRFGVRGLLDAAWQVLEEAREVAAPVSAQTDIEDLLAQAPGADKPPAPNAVRPQAPVNTGGARVAMVKKRTIDI